MIRVRRAVTALVAATVVAFVMTALLTPPDPITQLRTTAAIVLVATPLLYYAIGATD
ncbi:hypothetical protein [Halorientalis litorea]|uniref:hypothetical protein n=1 Tax=Halorientalis litorea TaxID=2931977 RepID=UPI001FF66E8A|nr:hypothetical protein [Halorientalis litorea]